MFSVPLILFGAVAPVMSAVLPNTVVPKTVYPEFIPGPGFPSLASLNLTTEMLHVMPDSFRPKVLAAREECTLDIWVPAKVDDVIVCFNFLAALGNYVIEVKTTDQAAGLNGARQVATSGTAHILAVNWISSTTSSIAYDVALGVQWSFNHCNSGGWVAGIAAANGNGNIKVYTTGFSS